MSDKKKEVLQEINFDSWDANGSPVTVTVDSLPLNRHATTLTTSPVGPYELDVITVSNEDITVTLDENSNGIKQGDLFYGWDKVPNLTDADMAPSVTINSTIDDE
tara:strand:+ start:336 stop:650 length:315 start_codon:yes stop_codon:yes gene_type:complete